VVLLLAHILVDMASRIIVEIAWLRLSDPCCGHLTPWRPFGLATLLRSCSIGGTQRVRYQSVVTYARQGAGTFERAAFRRVGT